MHTRGAWFERTPHSRCRISDDAFREKLRHRMVEGSTPTLTRCAVLATKVFVFPDPAGAKMQSGVFVSDVQACNCSLLSPSSSIAHCTGSGCSGSCAGSGAGCACGSRRGVLDFGKEGAGDNCRR